MADSPAATRTTLRGWIILAALFGMLGIGLWGRATHNGLLEGLGFLPPLVALLVFMIRSDRRARRDPDYARRRAEQRETFRNRPAQRARRTGAMIACRTLVIFLVMIFAMAGLTRQIPALARLWSGVPRPMLVPLLIGVPTLLATLWQKLRDRTDQNRANDRI